MTADKRVDVAIIGGGPAGAAAAEVLGRRGARVLVLDDNRRPGGQYLRGGRKPGIGFMDGVKRRGLELIDRLASGPVKVISRAEVLGIEAGFEILGAYAEGGIFTVKTEHILLATGAREKFIPFKGWTLPGVLAAGATQILIKQSGVLPAREILVAGAGLFLAAVAGDIRMHGGRVPAVLDEMPFARRIRPAAAICRHLPKLARGGALLARLLFSGTSIRHRTRLLEARGGDGVEEVVACLVDNRGEPIPGSETVFPVQCLALGSGFSPNTELAQLAGCELVHNTGLGGWVVKVNDRLESSVEGIWAAGEITAVGGAAKSLTEGRLAGYAILGHLGRLKAGEATAEVFALKKARWRQLDFARYFNAQHTYSRERLEAVIRGLPDDVPICRCETVCLGDLRRAVAEGFNTPAGLKKATRCGMGICQGSTCKTILLEVLAALSGSPLALIPPPSVRFPVKPVPLGALAGEKA